MNDLAKYVGKGVSLLLFQTCFMQDKVGCQVDHPTLLEIYSFLQIFL